MGIYDFNDKAIILKTATFFSVSLKMFLMVVYKKVKVTTRNLNPTHNVKQEKCLC